MRTFLINLDRDSDRLAVVRDRLDKAGILFERVSAVYGKGLSESEKRRAVCRLRFRMSMGRPVFDGEIGCALSHAKVYRKMIDENIPLACVLEDDVVVDERMGGALLEVEQFVDCDQSQVVLLSDHVRNGVGRSGIVRISKGMATEAYVLTLPAARALLKCLIPMRCACDLWGRWVKLGAIDLYGYFPAVANQAWDVFASHIKPKTKARRSMLVRALSGMGKVIDRALLIFERVRR